MNTQLNEIFNIFYQQDTTEYKIFEFYLNDKLILKTEPIIWDDESKASGDIKQWHDIHYELNSVLSSLNPEYRKYTLTRIDNNLTTGILKFYII